MKLSQFSKYTGAAVSTMSAVNLARTLTSDAKEKYNSKTLYTASLASDAYIYDHVLEWLEGRVKSRRIKFNSAYEGIKRHHDGTAVVKVDIEGHPFKVTVKRPEAADKFGDDEKVSSLFTDNLIFTTRSREGFDALQRFLADLTKKVQTRTRESYLYLLGTYGWEGRRVPKRDLDSIFLPAGLKENLVHDLRHYLDNEEKYTKTGLPYHRGYLFYGPPGNGKSSLAVGLANEFNMNIYFLSLSGISGDRELVKRITEVQRNSILLIEDIDIFSDTMGREQKKDAPTLAGLLNALDGVTTPTGLVTIITTNRVESLEDALIRPGRVDLKLELVAPNDYQVENAFKYVYNEELGVEPREFNSTAELSDIFKRFTFDPESARMEIKDGHSNVS